LLATLFVFVASTLLVTAHNHAAAKGEKESSCSICQIVHSHAKLFSDGASLQTFDLRPLFSIFLPNLSEISRETANASSIRGPPSLS
jgi:hypothetical protein